VGKKTSRVITVLRPLPTSCHSSAFPYEFLSDSAASTLSAERPVVDVDLFSVWLIQVTSSSCKAFNIAPRNSSASSCRPYKHIPSMRHKNNKNELRSSNNLEHKGRVGLQTWHHPMNIRWVERLADVNFTTCFGANWKSSGLTIGRSHWSLLIIHTCPGSVQIKFDNETHPITHKIHNWATSANVIEDNTSKYLQGIQHWSARICGSTRNNSSQGS